MIKTVDEQLTQARHFFVASPQAQQASAPQSRMAAVAKRDVKGLDNVPQMFKPTADTNGSVMQFNGSLPDTVSDKEKSDFAALLKDQQFYLQSGLGLVTAWMTDRYQRDPKQWANPQNWQTPLSNLPAEFYTPTDITQYQFRQSTKGLELAGTFLTTLIGWASGVGIVASFGSFITTLGEQIRAGITSEKTSMDTYHLCFGYQPIRDAAGNWQLVSIAEYYFLSFTQAQRTLYTSCSSAQMYDFDFSYQRGRLLLNWASLSHESNAPARKAWNAAIGGAAMDDVEQATNFFGTRVKPK